MIEENKTFFFRRAHKRRLQTESSNYQQTMDEFLAFMQTANHAALSEVIDKGALDADHVVEAVEAVEAVGRAAAAKEFAPSADVVAGAYECAWSDYIRNPTDVTNDTVNIAIALLRSVDNGRADEAQGRLNCAYAIYSASVFLPLPLAHHSSAQQAYRSGSSRA